MNIFTLPTLPHKQMLRATGLKKIKASSMLCLIVMLSGLFFLPDNVNGLEQVGDCIYL
jgi:hypothetical protein